MFLFQKGKQIKPQTTKGGNQIKCPTRRMRNEKNENLRISHSLTYVL